MNNYYFAGIVKEDDGSGYSVYFPDVPNVCAGGSCVGEAIRNAADGLNVALRGMVEDRQAIPKAFDIDTVKAKVRAERALDGLSCPEDTIIYW